MKQKFWTFLLGFAIATGLNSKLDNAFLISPVVAQSEPTEFSLEPMNIGRLDTILQDAVQDIQTEPGQWQFSLNDISIVVLADANANRMRIIAAVLDAEALTTEQVQNMLIANFHTALDARYAVSNGLVVSTFIHPLDSLQEKDLISAINQVASLATTFGTTYSSGELLFLPNSSRERSRPTPEENISI
ncbi:MAG: hypothetical protein AAGA80_04175 [Cyanobacteria bacterium P01_F01_bin.143]